MTKQNENITDILTVLRRLQMLKNHLFPREESKDFNRRD
jgi:hypothetical protein